MKPLNKKDIIQTLEKIAVFLEIQGANAFRISAYRKAAQALEKDDRSLEQIDEVSTLSGIGKGTAGIIEDLRTTGTTELLEELTSEVPAGLLPLLKVQGLGGKKLGKLYKELSVIDAQSLIEVCEKGKVSELPGFGKKSEEKILEGVKSLGERPERLTISQVMPAVDDLKKRLSKIDSIIRFDVAGSFRRGRETVKDLDFILSTEEPEKVREQILAMDHIADVIGKGETKISVDFHYGDLLIPADFRLVEDASYATMLHHFTGSKDHNVKLRQIAKERGEKISEYGVEVEESGEILYFKDEKEIFRHFELEFIPPEVREYSHEFDVYKNQHHLIELKDIRSDLHMHTTWSDGAQSIEEMALACKEKGYEYIALTDHSKYLQVANGLSIEKLKKQHEIIRNLDSDKLGIRVWTGIEMDILPDGSLDYEDDILQNIDFVIASIHSSFQQDEKTIMNRLRTACENPYVAMIAHPSGRLVGKREGYAVNFQELIEIAADTGTILELNANPNRLDLSAEWVEKAQQKGVKLAVNTDAHRFEMLDHMEVGIKTARRGWLQAENVVNTWSEEKLRAYISEKRKK